MSFIPFTGLNNFYRGDPLKGFCELVNGVMLVMSIITLCNCHNPNRRIYNHNASFWAVVIGIVIAFLDLLKVLRMMDDNGSLDVCEVIIIILSIGIAFAEKDYPIVIASKAAVVTGILEALRDIFTAVTYSQDGNGCPFV